MDYAGCPPNEGKQRAIETPFGVFDRYPIRTRVIRRGEDLLPVLRSYLPESPAADDYLFISEKVVAISQGRAWDVSEIRPSALAKVLCRFVYRSPYGIGLGSPWTMQLAIEEVRLPRLLFAAACSAVTKPFGVRGVFYKIVGDKGRAIDGPCDYTLPPYNHYAKLAPKDPDKVAAELEKHTGCKVVIMDANDIGREILGVSDPSIDIEMCKEIFRDNPLGQKSQQTPIAIIRRA